MRSSAFHRSWIGPFVLAACLSTLGSDLSGQSGRVTEEENIRAQPNGALLGRLDPGIRFDVSNSSADWIEFELEGWVWMRSLQVIGRDGFDLIVSATTGENIREAPSGDVIGRLETGVLLRELERVPGWVRVSRRVWIWRRSVDFDQAAAAPGETSAAGGDGGIVAMEDWTIRGGTDRAILSTPDGDTLAKAVPGSNLLILARQGNWARVRLDGWLWLPEGENVEAADVAVLTDVSVEDVLRSPPEYRGRVLRWDLQFISLERAEKIRTDFYEGEPFLLTKAGQGEGIFVYVAIPPERLAEARGLSPLERIQVVGRVRSGAASLTGSPILELLSLSRIPRR